MSVETKRIFHINAAATTLNNIQLCIEDTNDSDLGFQMWCGKDDAGVITKWLAKDQAARVTQLEATSRVLVTSGADITSSAASFTPSGNFSVDATSQILMEAGGTNTMKAGTESAELVLYPSSNGEIRFIDDRMRDAWTQKHVAHSDSLLETDTYKTDFGEVSLFEALHQCKAGGSVSEPDEQIVWGTGTGVDSDSNLTWDDGNQVLDITGKLTLENLAHGTETTATFASNTITANFSTGKDMQEVEINAHATTLALTAPTGGAAKDMTLKISTDGGPFNLGSGGDWADVWWDTNGTNLAVATLAIPAGDRVVLKFMYDGGQWFGWIHEFNPPG